MCENFANKIKPLVSICCLAYNHEKYIDKTLKGFIEQETTFEYEVLIHDDASSDNTVKIIKEYQRKYPNIIKPIFQVENQTSKGINVQKTYNYPRIKGRYVAYCEGDDYWCDKNKLQLQVEALEINKDCSISTHITQCISKDGKLLNSFFPPQDISKNILTLEDYLKSELIDRNWTFHLSSFMVRKEIIDYMCNNQIEFFNAFKRVGDFPLIVFSLTKGNLIYINKEMSHYRCFSGGFMTNWQQDKNSKINIAENFINGYLELDKYTNYKYHEIFEYGIRYCEFSKLIAQENFKELTNLRYNNIYNDLPRIKKIAINIGKYSKLSYRVLLKLKNKLELIKRN